LPNKKLLIYKIIETTPRYNSHISHSTELILINVFLIVYLSLFLTPCRNMGHN